MIAYTVIGGIVLGALFVICGRLGAMHSELKAIRACLMAEACASGRLDAVTATLFPPKEKTR